MEKQDIIKVLEELRKQEKKNFEQGVDLIINLKKIDIKKTPLSTFVSVPHKIKERKICAFLNKKSSIADTITKDEFDGYKEKKKVKKLARQYEFFIASASLMPSVASVFGRVLGTAGKMPSPQLGIVTSEDSETIKSVMGRINNNVRVKAKEPSIKVLIGKEKMSNDEIAENVTAVYNAVLNILPIKNDNVKSVLIKFTMGKPKKILLV
ncbi:hypothetical protein HYT92_01370 [Candidatus Pacearchaeota archaeon]|nr:hypothetical protein [Candidatus Pacearchaeota archaeon]